MRKGIFVTLLALFTVFAMVGVVSCGDKDSGTKPPAGTTFTIEKDLNWASVGATSQPTNPASVQTDTAKKLTTAQLAAPGTTQTPPTYEFDDWYTTASGGTKVTTGTVFTAAGKIYAHWTKAVTPGKAVITLDANGGTFPGGATTWSTPEFDPGPMTDELAEIIMADYPDDPVRAGYDFDDWYTLASGGIVFAPTTISAGTTTAYAHWTPAEGGGEPVEIVEEIGLHNGFYAIYRFDIPEGLIWDDFRALIVDYKINDASRLTLAGSSRAMRLMGPYDGAEDFEFIGLQNGSGKRMAVASFNSGKNTGYILDQLSNDQSGTIAGVAGGAGVTSITPGEWFTLPYQIDGARNNGGLVNYPDEDATGPFYFGIGWTGHMDAGATVQEVTKVTLVGYEKDVIGYPAIFEDQEGNLYGAFAGYPDTSGGNGSAATYRKTLSGEGEFDTIPVTLDTIPEAPVFETCACNGNDALCTCNDCGCTPCEEVAAGDTPMVIEFDDDETVPVHGSNLQVMVDGKLWGAMGDASWAMGNAAAQVGTSTVGRNATLLTYAFPSGHLSYAEGKVAISYEVRPWGDTTDAEDPDEVTTGLTDGTGAAYTKVDGVDFDYAISVKAGYDSWSTISGAGAYTTLSSDKTAKSGTLTFNMAQFTGANKGFAFQANVSAGDKHAEGFLLRVTKIVLYNPIVIEFDDDENVEAHGSNLQVMVDGKLWGAMGDASWAMGNAAAQVGTSTVGRNATLLTYAFPTASGSYEKVFFSYELRPWGDTTDAEDPDEVTTGLTDGTGAAYTKVDGADFDYAISVKAGYDSWSTISGAGAYTTLSSDKTAKSGTLTYNMAQFTGANKGFAFQANVSAGDKHAEGFLLRVSKIEFGF